MLVTNPSEWTDLELANGLKSHVLARGGPAKDDKGNIIMINGAWIMMLEAAKRLEKLC